MHRKYRDYDLSRIKNAKSRSVKMQFTLDSFIATFCFVGYFPFAQGTFGSLAAYPIYYYLLEYHYTSKEDFLFYMWSITIGLTIIGWWAIRRYQDRTNTMDHKSVVIDEVIGMLLTLTISFTWLYVISKWLMVFTDMKLRNIMFLVAFVAFRYFDISKPLIIGFIDRRYKKPFGVILDDILAGLMASGTIYIIYLIVDYFY